MKIVLQRVTEASVTIDGKVTGSIGRGYMVLLGVGAEDTKEQAEKLADKMIKLRIHADGEGKTNLSLADVEGELLIISQFTLYADCRKGNRPSFVHAGPPEHARELYDYFVTLCRERVKKVETGEFGAEMKVALVNDGPFTIVLEA